MIQTLEWEEANVKNHAYADPQLRLHPSPPMPPMQKIQGKRSQAVAQIEPDEQFHFPKLCIPMKPTPHVYA